MPFARLPWISNPLPIDPARLASRIGLWNLPALLESGPGFDDAGRWSFLAAEPRLVFEATGPDWRIHDDSGRKESGTGRVLDVLARLIARFRLADPAEIPDPDLPPFLGGLIGYIGYDLAPELERLPRKAPRDSQLADVRFALYDTAVAVDHFTGRVVIIADDLLDEGENAVSRRVQSWQDRLGEAAPDLLFPPFEFAPIESNFTKAEYLKAVRQSLEFIAAGDIFQVNLAQRFSALGSFDPLDLYLRLKSGSPAPFSAFLRWDDQAVISASPEWFYQTRGDRIVTRPIKGTRPRGTDPGTDAALIAELAESPKDRAELTMIVDLERNDLGRIARYRSVRVVDPLKVESFSQVHHLVATVEARIRPGAGPIDIVRALFPGGSITGAPKIRAMEIIDALEPTRRNLYTGAIGYFSRGGSAGFNIAIRTILANGDRVSYQVGGGIVADSDPETEYHETLHKGRGIREVLEGLTR